MKRIIITAIAAATVSSTAYAMDTATVDTLTSRSEPTTVAVFERDRGINGNDTIFATAGVPSMVNAGLILEPRDQAIAEDGQVTVYSFASPSDNSAASFPRR